MPDLIKTELYILGSIATLILFFGVYPEPLLDTINVSVTNLIDQYKTDINFYSMQKGN